MRLYSTQGWQSSTRLSFLALLPIGIALWYALVKAGAFAQHFPFPLALAYWACLLLPRWWLQDFSTRLLHEALRRLRPHRVLLLMLGGAFGIALFQPYALWLIGWFQQTFSQYIPAVDRYPAEARWDLIFQGFVGTLPQHLVALGLWVVGNLIYDAATGTRRFGYDEHPDSAETPQGSVVSAYESPATVIAAVTPSPRATADASASVASVPAFAARLRRVQARDIIAIEAEDHYVRVHGPAQSELIHYRFTDAVAELESVPGMRVHRSYWVARAGIRTLRRSGANQSLVLVNGTQIPIGRSYSEAVRQIGLVRQS